jgi:hypothetical protein
MVSVVVSRNVFTYRSDDDCAGSNEGYFDTTAVVPVKSSPPLGRVISKVQPFELVSVSRKSPP